MFVGIAREVCRRERLLVVCLDAAHRERVLGLLAQAGVDLGRVRAYDVSSNDTWARDHGPITVVEDGVPRLVDFRFNGWGAKHPAELDNLISATLHRRGAFGGVAMETVDLVLEGGSIDTDGIGSLLTTSRCLLSRGRNPQLDRRQIEARLQSLLGIERILWLEHGYLAGDDTDSHIDTLARFCDPRTIAYVGCDRPEDEHYQELQRMEEELRALRAPDGSPYTLVPLPWPEAKHDETGQRLPASYANFLVINEAVLVPTYEDPADAEALTRLQGCFPDRTAIGIGCLPLIQQYGSLHCVTMQLPEGVLT